VRGPHLRRVLVTAFFTVTVAATRPLPVRAGDNVAEWAPKDALFYVGVPGCDALAASIKKTTGWRSMEEPAVKDMVQPYKNLLENARKLLADELGLDSPKELEVYPHGGLALFLTVSPPPGEGQDPENHMGLVMDMGEDIERAQRLAKKVVQIALEKGGRREVEEIAGVEVTAIRFEENSPNEGQEDEPGAPFARADALLEGVELDELQGAMIQGLLSEIGPPEEFAFAFSRSRLVLGSDAKSVQATVRRLQRGAGASFAESAAMRLLRKHGDADAHLQFVFNLPRLIEWLGETEPDSVEKIRAVGVPALGPLVGTTAFMPSRGVEARMKGFLEIGPERAGLGNILLMENRRTAPPPGVSADTALYGALNLDPSSILKEIIGITRRLDQEQGETFQASLKVPQEDGSVLDIQEDVVGRLAGPLLVTLSLAKPYDADNVNVLLALGHKSREAMAKLLAMAPPNILVQREMLGHTVFEFPMVPGAEGAFTDRTLIPFGTKNAVEAYIRSEGKTDRGLADDPNFKRVARHAPRQSCAVFYVDGLKLADAQAALQETADADTPPMPGTTLGGYIRWGLAQVSTGGQIKDLKALRKYQTIGLFTISTESTGLRFDGVTIPALPED